MGPAATVTPIEELQADSTWEARRRRCGARLRRRHIQPEADPRKRQERAVATWRESFSTAGDRLRALADEITPETDPTTFLAADDERKSSLRPAMKRPSVGLRGSGTVLLRRAARSDSVIAG